MEAERADPGIGKDEVTQKICSPCKNIYFFLAQGCRDFSLEASLSRPGRSESLVSIGKVKRSILIQ